MSRASVTFGVAFIFMFQCCSPAVTKPATAGAGGRPADQRQSQMAECGIDGFTPAVDEHIIDEVERPFVVRNIHGKILNATGYGWTKDVRVLFEIREIGRTLIKKTYADENGDFSMEDIPDGRYCLKASVSGWQSVMGVIIVSKKADPKSKIVFEMRLGV